MKVLTLLAPLLLASCAVEQADRAYTPTEELWIDTYCHGDLVYRIDQERVAKWAEQHRIMCPQIRGIVSHE